MYSLRQAFVISACVALTSGQNIISAVGSKSSNTSVGLQVDLTDPNDFNIIRTAEISSNVVNQCGRTVAGGNIDVGAKTEDALANGAVTSVTAGSSVKVTMSVNSTTDTNFTCDLDPQGNVAGATGQTALTQKTANTNTSKNSGKNNKGNNRKLVVRHPLFVRAKNSASANTMTLTVDMPTDLSCIGASAGNVCTVRCINADEVGGCFAVQQTDTTALPGDNDPSNIATTAKNEAQNQAQIDQNNKDIDAAKAAIAGSSADALTDEGAQNAAVASAIIAADPSVTQAAAAATSSAAASSGKSGKSGKAGKNGKNNKNNNKQRDLPVDQRLSSRRSYELLSDE